MQRDDGLADAGTAGDRGDAAAGCADRLVLLGLDGRDDGVHGAVAGAGQLRHQRALAEDRQVVDVALGVEQLVLDADHGGALRAQHPAADDVLRLGGGGLVEHGGGGRTPVDEQGVAVLVAQADPADVARVGVDLGPQVEPPEDEPLVGRVELRDPLGRLEDHGVALDQPALVTEPTPVVTLPRQLLGRQAGVRELAVDAVDECLLVGDLLLDQLFCHQLPPRTRICGKFSTLQSRRRRVSQFARCSRRERNRPAMTSTTRAGFRRG